MNRRKWPVLILCMIVLSAASSAQPGDSSNVRLLGSMHLPHGPSYYGYCVTWTDSCVIVSSYIGYDVSDPGQIRLLWEVPRSLFTYATLYDDSFFYEANGSGKMSRVTASGLQPIDSMGSIGYLISLAKRGDSLYFGSLEANIILACDSAHARLLRRSVVGPEPLWLPTAYCAVVWQDGYLFATDLDFGLKVFGLDDPTSPNLIASLALPDDPFDLKVLGSRAYVAADQAGVIIVDISNPQLPSVVSQFNVGGRSQQLAIAGTHLFVADHDRGLRIFSLQDPDQPSEVGCYDRGYGIQALCVHDSLVFACDTANFMVLDCGQALPVGHVRSAELPHHFELLTNYPNPFNSQTVFRYRLTNASDATLIVYDVLGRIVWEYPLNLRDGSEGSILWAGTNRSGDFVASGVYFCQLTNHHESKTIKILLLR